MSNDPNDVDVTALVVLRSASGRPVHGDAAVTTETLGEVMPDPADVAVVESAFRGLGFSVGPPFGISMSVTAQQSHVERIFGVRLREGDDGSWIMIDPATGAPAPTRSADGDVELPMATLPDGVVRLVSAIVIEPPVQLFGELTP